MECPKCGYVLSPFEPSCARCARMPIQTAAPDPTVLISPSLPPQQPAALPPYQKRSLSASNGFLIGIISCCASPVVLLLLIALWSAVTYRKPPPPGPETLALSAEMKQWQGVGYMNFLSRFGAPPQTSEMRVGGVSYIMWTYPCRDGHVFIAFNRDLRFIERIDADGDPPS